MAAARIGIDTGGTFTDVVRWSRGGLLVTKVPSTPDDPGRAVLSGIAAVRRTADEPVDVVHGTTVGLNAVLQGRLPRTALVTNRGFRDLIEIGRQERTDLYTLEPDRPAPPVPRELRVEVACRRDAAGGVVEPLTAAAIAGTVRRLAALRPEAVAVGLLHSPAAPADERRLADAITRALPGVPVTCSAELWPAFGEYERFSAAILNAAITPLVGTYTARLSSELGNGRLRLLRSSLGILPPEEAARFPARAMFSGPAGGALATGLLARRLGFAAAAALDMGGTSTDVCLVQDGERTTARGSIAGLPLPLPAVDVHTIGCGGGSIAYRDAGGALRVGPQSAGADPGPACYGRGDQPTVTDAHMALGHMGADTLLGGGMHVDPDRSVRAIERLGKRVGMRPRAVAEGILAIAEVHMARALMVITVERAIDPARVPLIAYGGAGGLHAAALATSLGMPRAIVPEHPGAFSAVGLALAGESAEVARALRLTLDAAGERSVRSAARELGREALASLGDQRAVVSAEVMLRYRGQGEGLHLPLTKAPLLPRFLAAHRARFGFAPTDVPVEVVHLRARADAKGPNYPVAGGARHRDRRVMSTSLAEQRRRPPLGGTAVRVLRREDLRPGQEFAGPCVIEEPTAVTRVTAGVRVAVRPLGLELSALKR